MTTLLKTTFFLFVFGVVAIAQTSLEGVWEGAITLPGGPLEVTLTLNEEGDGYTGTIDIPAQDVADNPLSASTAGDQVTINLANIPGEPTFEGEIAGSSLSGTFTQGGQSFDFSLEQAEEGDAAEATASESTPEVDAPPASSDEARAALERLFSEDASAEQFAPSFLDAVSFDELQSVISNLETQLGVFERVELEGEQFNVVFAEGSVPTTINLDNNGLIDGLFFATPISNLESLDDVVNELEALPGVSLLVTQDDETIASLNEEESLAVGSAFKLAVLRALKESGRSLDEVVELDPAWKSLPTGFLQDWPDDTPLTLATLSALMISISDNTAANALIETLGRETIEPYAGVNVPLLNISEAFKLKMPANEDLLTTFSEGDEAAKREVLEQLDERPLPQVSELSSEPVAIDTAEWFFTSSELCDLIESVADMPAMSINPGLANPADWESVAYKGGSEAGVLNLTSYLEHSDGRTFCVVLTQNDSEAALEEATLTSLYSSLLAFLRDN